jgi:hypothetical protein
MSLLCLIIVVLLTACTSVVTQQVEPLDIVRELAFIETPEVQLYLEEEGSAFLGNFAASSALNSQRTFVSDFHGEIRITMYPNKKVECRWWADGRITDPTVYEGSNGFIETYSTLCTGKLQRDGSFEFRGVYLAEGPEHASGATVEEEPDDTFTLKGKATDEIIQGTLLVGGVLRNTVTLEDSSVMLEEQSGILFEAVLIE